MSSILSRIDGCFVIKDGAENNSVGLTEEMELRLRFSNPVSRTQKQQNGRKKVANSEQVGKQKFDGGQRNDIQSHHASDKYITLVFVLFCI